MAACKKVFVEAGLKEVVVDYKRGLVWANNGGDTMRVAEWIQEGANMAVDVSVLMKVGLSEVNAKMAASTVRSWTSRN